MAFDWGTGLVGFLLGTVTGAAGIYFGNKYTDQRKKKESARDCETEFAEAKRVMPELIKEMRDDISTDTSGTVREFFVLPNRRVSLGGSSQRRFAYYEEEHDNLLGKIAVLENKGLVFDVTPGNAPVFRMTEEFIELVKRLV